MWRGCAGCVIGVLDGTHCFCGDPAQLSNASAAARARPLAECSAAPCKGAGAEKCGGVDRLAIYNFTTTGSQSPWLPHS